MAVQFNLEVRHAVNLCVGKSHIDKFQVRGPGILKRVVRADADFRSLARNKTNFARFVHDLVAGSERHAAGASAKQQKQRENGG